MTLNTYDKSKDLLSDNIRSQVARKGTLVVPSDTDDFTNYLLVCVVVTGDVKFLPVINDTADPITMASLPVGYIIPWQVRRIFATDTTATLRTIDKVY